MKIFIDNSEADIDEGTNVAISLSVASHTQLETSKTGYAKTITIPMTQRNRGIMGDSEQISSPTMFNRQEHTARIEQDGFTVIEGTPQLIEASSDGSGGGFYKICIIGSGKRWVKHAAETPLRTLEMDIEGTMSAEMVRESWTWNKPVRFLPVMRDGYEPDNVNNELFEPQKILTLDDYHPFVHVRSIIEKTFADAGYTVKSDFMTGSLFDSLYMSGNYPKSDGSANAKALMDFKAGRFASKSAAADNLGRVYATPYSNLNTVGNIVETANPNETVGGVSVSGVYSVGGHFKANGSHMEFAPPSGVTIGFEYALYYKTDYTMKNSRELTCFDTVYLGDGEIRTFKIANPFEDQRNKVAGYTDYRVIIFDYDSTKKYRFSYKGILNSNADLDNLQSSDYISRTYNLALRSMVANFQIAVPIAHLKMEELPAGSSEYVSSNAEWAIYNNYVTESGAIDVEITVRSSAERITPSQPKTFYDIWFGGAAQGMTFTLGQQTTVKPIFASGVWEGMAVDFGKIANHNVSCLDIINAVKQMFNLYFITDHFNKTVYIEPRKDFYAVTPIIDWSGRIDLSKPIVVSEPGADMYKKITFGYASGDDAVAAWNRKNEGAFGKWSADISNLLAKDGEKNYDNPVFTPSISEKNVLNTAPSALLLHAGESEEEVDKSGGDQNFPPKIVRYLGMRDLPAGESWGWPSNGNNYPFLTFHYKGDANNYDGANPNPLSTFALDAATLYQNGLSLCFEDRDGVAGIHRFWDGNITTLNEGKRVELSLMLYPEDIEPMLSPNNLGRDFRALYRLMIDGESALFRLEEICDYNPAAGGSTKCIFVKES